MFGAVDIGGTKTLVGAFNEKGHLLKKVRFPTPALYEDFKIELAKNAAALEINNYKVVTVAVPGKVDRNHGIGIAFGNLSWENVKIREDAEKIFNCPVLLENDAKLAGLSEAAELKQYKKVLYITISTGINGGFIVNGSIDKTLEDSEMGMMMFEHGGRLMQWQSFASGKAIFETYGKPASEINDHNIWDRISHNIAIGLIDLIATLTPNIIVLGGGVGAHYDKFEKPLERELDNYRTNLLTIPPIVQAKRAEEAVMYGCFELGKLYHE